MKTINTTYGRATIKDLKYTNGRRAIQLIDYEDGSPIACLTVNLPNNNLEPDEFFVKTWSENEEIAKDCLKSGMFIDTGKRVSTGFVQAQVWKEAK